MLQALLDRIRPVETAAALTVNILLSLLLVVIGLALARAAKGRLVRAISRSKASGNLAALLGNAAFLGVVLVTLLLVLRVNGLEATALLAVLGVGTVAIGLALQDVLKNLIAGTYLLLEQPFRIGDHVVVDGREGEVESIDIRVTVLRLRDGSQALVPNAIVLATTVLNRTAYPTRRVIVRVSGLTDDLDTINSRVQAALRDQPGLAHTPGPQVRVEAISEGKATVLIELWRHADQELPPAVPAALRAALPGADVAISHD
jgi:small-conductance mechanosensitive channel